MSACTYHTFPEEQEPGGRLILAPCLTCNMSAADGMADADEERDRYLTLARVAARHLRAFAERCRECKDGMQPAHPGAMFHRDCPECGEARKACAAIEEIT